ncbi:capsular polysaccharide repeat unit transporter [Pusillimonas sp. T7-7]|uniref:lipopolysaccharide biosynthesis protein n=1 Tax=Pusillimonas sp. (strain T7-7) TaxID=1007105 RepID=UPI0002084E35|nr:lipopolysaccharide biosynthesis protein [Pusillimonas sp. T7-7]AEC21759.1 capsular polysaccharide repeat unit transporter [Pusillimonas sp. T7-7]
MSTLGKQVGHGIAWNLANMVVSRGASVVFTLFLARFLTPDAFGLMAMIAICYALADVLMVSGFGQAIIRQKNLEDVDLSTAFVTNLVFSVLLYLALYLAAPWVARFYEQAELIPLIRVIGLVLFINAFKVVQLALLNRDMNFKSLMHINSAATIVAGTIAVLMAYAGLGVWSLVGQFMISAAVSTGLLWITGSWRANLGFSTASFKRMFGFGSKLTLESSLNVLYENSYVLVIGRVFSAEATGLYYFAKRIRDLVVDQLNAAVQQATYPAMSQLQDELAGLRTMYRLVLQLLFFITAPALLLVAVLAEPLFQIAFDPRWIQAVPYLQLLCIAGILLPIHTVNFNMLKVRGRTDLVLYTGITKKAIHLALLAASIPFGLIGIVTGQILAVALSSLYYMHCSATQIGYTWGAQLRDMFEPIIVATLAAGATAWLMHVLALNTGLHAVAGALCFALLYLVLSHIGRVAGYIFLRKKLHAWRHRNASNIPETQT